MTASDGKFEVRVSEPSGQYAVRNLIDRLFTELEPLALDVEEKGTIEIVLAEALNNIVEHAYPEPNASGPIAISATHQPNGLRFCICDYGKPMPEGQAPIGQAADINVEMSDLPEGGFGWFLIRDLAKEVAYTRDGEANVLDLRIAIAGKP